MSKSIYRRIEIMSEDDLVALEDGYFYYFPSRVGALSANELRVLADLLDKKNAAWHKQVCEEMS